MKTEVLGFAKPGANMEEIVNTIRKDIKTLNKKDVVIVWGGSNDVSKNNTSGAINQLCKFVEGKNGRESCVNESSTKTRFNTNIMCQ
jgi:hypothetical protein